MNFMIDWVGVYTIVYLTLNLFLPVALDGHTKFGQHDWYDGIFSVILMLPLIGRIFGVW